MGKLDRRCWWCDGRLSDVAQATITEQLGNTVVVHCYCKKPAEEFVRGSRLSASCASPEEIAVSATSRDRTPTFSDDR